MSTYKIDIGGHIHTIKITKLEGATAHLQVDGKPIIVSYEKQTDPSALKKPAPVSQTPKPDVSKAPPSQSRKAKAPLPGGGIAVEAPIPGLVLEIKVKPGDSVKTDQILMVMEAMKMENPIKSPTDGIVKEILVKAGDGVATDDVLVLIG